MNISQQPSQQKPPIPQNPTNNLTTNTITNDNNMKNNRTGIQSSNNNKTMNKSQPSQQKPQIPQKPINNLTTNTTTNDKNTKNNRTDIQPSSNNKTVTKSQPSQQKPQIPQKPTNNLINNTMTNDKNTKNNRTDINKPSNNNSNNKVIWDCGSSLYDSFERDSFRKQIDTAIINSARTLSMPRLPSENRRAPSPNLPEQSKKPSSSKFSRSFQKLLRSVFRGSKSDKKAGNSGNSSPDPWFFDPPVSYEEKGGKKVDGGGKYIIVYDKPEVVNGLTTIPEVPEVNFSPEIGSSLVRKTMSERFTSASFGIHCA